MAVGEHDEKETAGIQPKVADDSSSSGELLIYFIHYLESLVQYFPKELYWLFLAKPSFKQQSLFSSEVGGLESLYRIAAK